METTKNNIEIGYKVHLEEGKDFNTSIFKSVYESAKESVKDIVVNTVRIGNHNYTIHKSYNDDYNNIIAFTGERGRGKSSSMISFLDAIVNKSKKIHMDFFVDDEELSWARYSFATIDVIDPTLFREREKETLFEIVIAKMFSAFRKTIEDKVANCNIKDEQRRSVIKSFQNVFENLKYLKNRDDIFKEDALDALIKLSTSSNLKDSFDRLVEEYLEVLGEHGKTNFLVIAIDDFDLKIDGVYEMLEDVRRFLISRKIILLISCKMEQMRQALFQKLKVENGDNNQMWFLCKVEQLEMFSTENSRMDREVKNQVEKYLEKLFPVSRVIEMPSPQEIDWNEEKLRAFFYDDTPEPSNITVEPTFNKGVLRKIYEKLGLFIAEDPYTNNLFIGNSMRSVIGLKRSWNEIGTLTKYVKTYFNQTVVNLTEIDFILECDLVVLNYRVYKLLYNSFKLILDKSDIELLKNDALSYESYQKEDINSLFFIINEKIKQDSEKYDLYRAIKIMYILRIDNILEMDFDDYELVFKNFNIGSIINVELLPAKYRISSYRDAFISKQKPYDIGKNTNKIYEKIIIYSFVYSLGRDIFADVRMGGQFTSFGFSILNFINSINNIELIINRFTKEDFEIKKYKNSWIYSKYFKLFNNSDFIMIFYREFVDTYNYFSKEGLFKEKRYSDIVYTILYDGMTRIFNQINAKYAYLNLDYEDFVRSNKIMEIYLKIYKEESVVTFVNNAYSLIQENKTIWQELDTKINGKSRLTTQWFSAFISKISNDEIREYLLDSHTQSLMFAGINPELRANRNLVLEEVKRIENNNGQSAQND